MELYMGASVFGRLWSSPFISFVLISDCAPRFLFNKRATGGGVDWDLIFESVLLKIYSKGILKCFIQNR